MGQENFSQLNASAEGAIRRLAKKGLIFSVVLTGATAVIENITHQTPSAAASSPSCDVHREVLGGDTLSAIARKYPDVTWEQIQAANNLTNPNFIRPGQNLIIPQLCSPANEAIGGQELPAGSVVLAKDLVQPLESGGTNAKALKTLRLEQENGMTARATISPNGKLETFIIDKFDAVVVVGANGTQGFETIFTYTDQATGKEVQGRLGIEKVNFLAVDTKWNKLITSMSESNIVSMGDSHSGVKEIETTRQAIADLIKKSDGRPIAFATERFFATVEQQAALDRLRTIKNPSDRKTALNIILNSPAYRNFWGKDNPFNSKSSGNILAFESMLTWLVVDQNIPIIALDSPPNDYESRLADQMMIRNKTWAKKQADFLRQHAGENYRIIAFGGANHFLIEPSVNTFLQSEMGKSLPALTVDLEKLLQ